MFKILRANNHNDYLEWRSIWKCWKGKEIFAHPDYLSLYNRWSEVMCAIYSKGEQIVMFPFCLREIIQNFSSTNYFDIITPYGYGDIYFIGNGEFNDLLQEFQYDFYQWAFDSNVVCEFIRFDILSKSRGEYNGEVVFNNDNVVCDLTKGKSVIWKEFKPKVRRNVRKAFSNNLRVEVDYNGDRLETFIGLYYRTMNRLNAETRYYFSKEYFRSLNDRLKGNYAYFFVMKGDVEIAVELVFISDEKIYYYLGGSNEEYFGIRPNDLLNYEIIKWGVDNNRKYYILGGGFRYNDNLFKYKKDFAPESIYSYKVGVKIYNQEVYNTLTKNMNTSKLSNKQNSFFPLYRKGNKDGLI